MNKLTATGLEFLKYGLVGLTGFSVEFAVFNLFLLLIPFEFFKLFSVQVPRESVSHTISVIVGALICFALNKIWSFRRNNPALTENVSTIIEDKADISCEKGACINIADENSKAVSAKSSAVTAAQLFRYSLLFGFNLILSNALLLLFSRRIGLQFAKVGIMCVLVPWNFIMYKLLVYNPKLDPKVKN